MAKKNQIAIGQCYEKDDQVFMVIAGPFYQSGKDVWTIQNNLTKRFFPQRGDIILTWRRAFQNWEGS